MIVLDTSYVSLFQYPEDPRANRRRERLVESTDHDIVTTAITPEEQMRGWLSAIHGQRDVNRQVQYYERLVGLFRFFAVLYRRLCVGMLVVNCMATPSGRHATRP